MNIKFEGLDPILRKRMLEAVKFMVPHARHSPQFKLKRWDGKIAFGTIGGGTYLNLLDRVIGLVEAAGYQIELEDRRPDFDFVIPDVEEDFVSNRMWPAGHVMAGEPILLRDYQVKAINGYLKHRQCIQSICTGAGKTLITAVLSLIVEQSTNGRSIVIVPSKSLVEQTEEDYLNLGLDVGVYYGDRKEWNHKHLICTWQSLAVLSDRDARAEADVAFEDLIENVQCVMVDEAHSVRGNELRELLCGPLARVPLRFGLTGTVPKDEYEFMGLFASLGPVVGEITAKELMEKSVLARCEVDVIQLKDDHVEFEDYEEEKGFLLSNRPRIAWIAELCRKLTEDGNTLVLVDRVECGQMLERLIPGSTFIYGGVKTSKRKSEYKSVQKSDNKIIIATYGVAAVGINVPRIFNLVLLEAGKSFTRVIQSIGRGIRKAHDKDFVAITDLTSSLKFSKRHLTKRKTYYADAGYPFKVRKVTYI